MAIRLGVKAKKAEPLLDYREDPHLKAITARLAEIAEQSPKLRDQAQAATRELGGAEEALHRAELAVLAGRAGDADLIGPQQRLLDLKRTEAVASCDLDDLQRERAKLEAELPKARVAAKQAALRGIRQRYLALLEQIQTGLEQAIAADEEVRRLVNLAADEFGSNSLEANDDIPASAGLRTFGYSNYYRGYGYEGHALGRDLQGYQNQVQAAHDAVETADKQSN